MSAYLTKAMFLSMLSMIPQTNGLDERMNQTVTKAIVKYLNPDQDDWDEHIDAILFSYHIYLHQQNLHHFI